MSQVLSLFLRLNCVAVLTVCSITATFSQTTTPQAATTTPASKTVQPTGPGGRPLTPAEIRLREKQAKWIEDQRRYKAEMAELQRKAQLEQAEKERKRKEKEEAKAREKQEKEAAKLAKQQQLDVPKSESEPKAPEPAKPAVTNAPADATAPVSAASPFTPVAEVDEKKIAKEKKEAEALSRKQEREAAKERERQQKEADRLARQQADEAEKARIRQQKEAREAEELNRRQVQAVEQEKTKQEKEIKETEDRTRRQTQQADALKTKQEKEAREAAERNRRQEQVAEQAKARQSTPSTIHVQGEPKVAATPAPAITPTTETSPTATKPEAAPVAVTSSSTPPEFLPKGHLFAPIMLDPLEAQTYGSVLPNFVFDKERYKGAIVPFAFGFIKPFYRWGKKRSNEIGLDLASYTQFEVYRDKDNVQRRQIMNNDYKVSIFYNIRSGRNSWRIRGYHLSSHLGDDYLIRNQINYRTPNPVNYELIDVTYSRDIAVLEGFRYYMNLGYGLRRVEERAKMSAQVGFFYRKPDTAEGRAKVVRPVAGVDVKFWQQTDFRPGIHFGAGIEVGRSANNLTFLLESYTGFRPYSQYENQLVRWFGIGLYLNPF